MIETASAPWWTRMSPRHAFILVLIVGIAARLWSAFDDGIFWPDEIYQSLEPAHWLLYGTGLLPWEFIEGARNWSVPGAVACLLKLCEWVGLDSPSAYVRFVKIVFALLSALAALGIFRLVKALGASASEWPAFAAASLWLLASPIIYFAPRALSENLCAVPMVWGLVLLFEEAPTGNHEGNRKLVAANVLLGLSVIFRLLSLPVVGGAMLALLLLKRWHAFKVSMLVLSAMAVLAGAFDAMAWHDLPDVRFGGWFHSVVYYVRFNLYGGSLRWGTSPWWFFLEYLYLAMPTVGLVLIVGVLESVRRGHRVMPLLLIPFFILHMASPHKESRFIIPGLMLACACSGVAISYLQSQRMMAAVALATCLLALISTTHLPRLTLHELRARLTQPDASVWDVMGHTNRLMLVAGRQPDLCGLRFDVDLLAWSGGSTYLHRPVPIYAEDADAQEGHFNYVIARVGQSDGHLIAQERGAGLYKLPIDRCTPDPGFRWKLR